MELLFSWFAHHGWRTPGGDSTSSAASAVARKLMPEKYALGEGIIADVLGCGFSVVGPSWGEQNYSR